MPSGRESVRLIVNADDYGRSEGVSRGIRHAHRKGIVTSTTLMINQAGAQDALTAALELPGLGVGLHLVFTAGCPVLAPARLGGWTNARGCFLDQHTVWARAQSLDTKALRDEFLAQLELFRVWADRLPDHLDCHHFAHLYPPFFAAYVDVAAQAGLPLRVPFPPETALACAAPELPYLEGFPRDVVRGMIVSDSALLRARHVRHPDRFLSTFFGRESVTLEHLLALLDGLQPGTTELMCHPGYDSPDLARSSYRSERELELALLCHPAVQDRIVARGIELVTFGQLA